MSVAPTYLQVKLFAERILQAIGDTEPIGRGWISAFLKRNPSVKVQRSRPIDSRRINGASTEVIRDWFNLLAIPEIKGIKPANRYNMDETGILEGQGSNGLVLGMAKTKSVRKKQPGSRAWSSSSGFLWILALMKDSSLLQQRMDRLQMILQLNGCRRSSSLRPSLRARRKELGYLSQWNDSTIIGKRNFIGCYQKARLAGLTIDNIKSAKPLISPLMLPSTPGPSDQGSKGIQGQAGTSRPMSWQLPSRSWSFCRPSSPTSRTSRRPKLRLAKKRILQIDPASLNTLVKLKAVLALEAARIGLEPFANSQPLRHRENRQARQSLAGYTFCSTLGTQVYQETRT
ncbi:hypothetical protein CTA1_2149 [Colletotrichum tanaceti]|uniref:HTH CENPB-type domain-containing protein n=1 Tax=Colletotrichum tanaceti TaxID=1306861 RepID=A0A4U6X8J5_9PEZI|nr:hypothetical protein CTA1_2149 [Colletotrichum tanaceti]